MNYKTIKSTLKSAGLTLAGITLGYLPFLQTAEAEGIKRPQIVDTTSLKKFLEAKDPEGKKSGMYQVSVYGNFAGGFIDYSLEYFRRENKFLGRKTIYEARKVPGATAYNDVVSTFTQDGGEDTEWVGPTPFHEHYVTTRFAEPDGRTDLGTRRNNGVEERLSPEEAQQEHLNIIQVITSGKGKDRSKK